MVSNESGKDPALEELVVFGEVKTFSKKLYSMIREKVRKQSKLHKNSNGREITLDRNEHGRHEGKGSWPLKNLDTQEKPTTPVEGIHKPKDRTGDHRDYLKNSK